MTGLYISPSHYFSGYDILDKFGEKVRSYGKKVLILSEENILTVYEKAIDSLKIEKIDYEIDYFRGVCSRQEIDRVVDLIKEYEAEAVIGIGGGKLLDTAKAAGYKADVDIITVPSIAATCAAWSSHSAVYDKNGVYEEYFDIYKNPDLLFIDKKIIAQSDVRYTVSGIVDTLAKWVETDAYTSNIKERSLELDYAIYLAKKSYNELMAYGVKAVKDIKSGVYSKEVEKTIDHIILTAGLIGGIGGEACRSVAAHAVNNGFTVIYEKYNKMLHGEVVGFGNIVQMVLDKKDEDKIIALAEFYKEIGAPMSLEDFDFQNLSEKELRAVVNKTIAENETIWNLSYKVDYNMVKNAILKADEILKRV